MKDLIKLFKKSESWLIKKILSYAKKLNYTKYTSTLEEAWRLSISGLTASLIEGIKRFKNIPELGPDDDYKNDPLTSFGVIEAKRHRERGVTLSMFLGLMKYYKQSYIDLINEKYQCSPDLEKKRLFIERSFDRIEIAFCQEWNEQSYDKLINELQTTNRFMTNEKNAYLTAFESLTDPVIILNENFKIKNINHSAALIINPYHTPGADYYHPKQKVTNDLEINRTIYNDFPNNLIDLDILDLFPCLNNIIKIIKKHPKSKKIYECQALVNDEVRYYDVKFSRMLDVSEKYSAIIIILRDITKRKETEKLLKESELKFKKLAETSPIAILIYQDDKWIYANKSALNITGYKKSDLLSMNYWEILHPDYKEYLHTQAVSRLKGKIKLKMRYEAKIITKNGAEKWIDISAGSMEYEGRPAGILTAIDITERKEAEKALKENEEKLKIIINNMSDYIYSAIIKHNGQIETEWITGPIEKISGYSFSEIKELKEGFASIVHPADLKKIYSLQPQLFNNKPVLVEYRIFTKNGDTRWIRDYMTPIWDNLENRVTGLLGGVQDITDRKNLEHKLTHLATTDTLTGANNRHQFLEKSKEAFIRYKRYGGSLSFMMIDIDHFKDINDTYGHPIGDRVLKMMVNKSLKTLREPDIFGRLGGEEFGALLLEIDAKKSINVAERLRKNIHKISIKTENDTIKFTVSIGLTDVNEKDQNIEDIMNRADRALYNAKDNGRNCVVSL